MQNNNMRLELKIGLIAFAITKIAEHLFVLPDFVNGLLLGLSIALMVVGLLPERIYAKILKWRKQNK